MKIRIDHTERFGIGLDYNEGKLSMRIADIDERKRSDLNAATDPQQFAGVRIGGSLPRSLTSEEMRKSFNSTARRNKYIGKNSVHIKVSVDPDDRDLSNYEFNQIANRVLSGLGYAMCKHSIYRHYDEPHPHIHIVASRVDCYGKTVPSWKENIGAEKICRKLEKEFGLISARGRRDVHGIRGQRYHEKLWEEKTGIQSWKSYIKDSVVRASQGNVGLEEFQKRLWRDNVTMQVREYEGYTDEGKRVKKYGISYGIDYRADRAPLRKRDSKLDLVPPVLPKPVGIDLPLNEYNSFLIGDNIRKARKFRKKSQNDLADSLGWTKKRLQAIETGKTRPGDIEFGQLENELGFSKEVLLMDDFHPFNGVRAARLGPKFQAENLLEELNINKHDLKEAVGKRFQYDEPPEQTRLLKCILHRNEEDIATLIKDSDDLVRMEVTYGSYFNPNDKEWLQNLIGTPRIKTKDLIDNALTVYRNHFGEANEATATLLENTVNSGIDSARKVLGGQQKNFIFYGHESFADPRIIGPEILNTMEVEDQQYIAGKIDSVVGLSRENPPFDYRPYLKKETLTERMSKALRMGNPVAMSRMLQEHISNMGRREGELIDFSVYKREKLLQMGEALHERNYQELATTMIRYAAHDLKTKGIEHEFFLEWLHSLDEERKKDKRMQKQTGEDVPSSDSKSENQDKNRDQGLDQGYSQSYDL
jgi:transcriptional regulator with XRE-family HTH domain